MTNDSGPASAKSRVTLDKINNIDSVGKLHTKLKKSVARGVDVNLRGGEVEVIDTTALQLLLAFVREVRTSGNNVNWQSSSQALCETAKLSGLINELGLEARHS